MKVSTIAKLLFLFGAAGLPAFESDNFDTAEGSLKITFIGHGTLMIEWSGIVIHVDPVGQFADYKTLPKADLILVTHQHSDHLDAKAIGMIEKPDTEIILNPSSADILKRGTRISNGQSHEAKGIQVKGRSRLQHHAGPG